MHQTAEIECPHCGQSLEIVIDPSVASQSYIEDCQICCKPIQIRVRFKEGEPQVDVEPTD